MTWLDVMPAIPLARGVPVVHVVDKTRHTIVLADAKGDECLTDRSMTIVHTRRDHMRVDLDDPQGFGYAFRRLWLHPDAGVDTARFSMAWLSDTITDADRIALAKALAEVADGER